MAVTIRFRTLKLISLLFTIEKQFWASAHKKKAILQISLHQQMMTRKMKKKTFEVNIYGWKLGISIRSQTQKNFSKNFLRFSDNMTIWP